MESYWQYIVLLGAVVIVFAFALPRKKQHSEQPSQTIQNMETALEQFMENMEKDNQELVALVADAQREAKAESERKDIRISELERKAAMLERQLQAAAAAERSMDYRISQAPAVQPEPPAATVTVSAVQAEAEAKADSNDSRQSDNAKQTIHARYSELFQLYEQGKSIEAISRKLGMNKGEVQLIMQLAKQEDAANA